MQKIVGLIRCPLRKQRLVEAVACLPDDMRLQLDMKLSADVNIVNSLWRQSSQAVGVLDVSIAPPPPAPLTPTFGAAFEDPKSNYLRPIIAYGSRLEFTPRRVLDLARAGITEIVTLQEEDDSVTLSKVLRRTLAAAGDDMIIQTVAPGAAPEVRRLLAAMIAQAAENPSPDEMSHWIHRERSAVYRLFRKAQLSPPHKILSRIRGFLVLQDAYITGCSIECSCLRYGYRSGSGFTTQIVRLTGLTPTQLLNICSSHGTHALAERVLRTVSPPPNAR